MVAGFPGDSDGEESACNSRDPGSIPGLGRSPRKGMVTHSSILAWRIPQTEEPGGFLWEEPGGPWGHRESDTTEQLTLSHDLAIPLLGIYL